MEILSKFTTANKWYYKMHSFNSSNWETIHIY